MIYNQTMPSDSLSSVPLTIEQVIDKFIESTTLARSANTARTYRNGMNIFVQVLRAHKIDPNKTAVSDLQEDAIIMLANELKDLAPTTERLYLTAATQLFEYIAAENIKAVNLSRIRLLIHQRARRPGQRLPQFPRSDMDLVLEYISGLNTVLTDDPQEKLRNLRDRAFLITLADTGLRVHEACGLRRGDIDWNEGQALVIGKGNQQAVIRFSQRALTVLKEYISARAQSDGKSGKPLSALPLFARHDKGAGKKTLPITTATGRNIVTQRVVEALGDKTDQNISPHSFRHYFVTRVLQSSGNLKLAQELARHKNIAVTTRYAHLSNDELDKGYWEIFDQDN